MLRPDVLLEKVNGAIFAPASFKEHCHSLVSNTGIIPKAKLRKIFPNYDINMIVQFLLHLELCQPVIDTTDASKTLTDCVFFPCLVSVNRLSDVTIPPSSFVWQMSFNLHSPNKNISSGSEFFTTRCLHALMHRLTKEFTLPSNEFKFNMKIHQFSRRCKVWSRGIAWKDALAISFVVEMDKSLQCLSFAVSTEKDKNNPKYPVQHNRVLCVIKKCCEDFCLSLAKNMKECIRCPSLPCLGPSITEVELPLLRNAISFMSPESYTIKEVDLKEWIKAEPQLPLLIGVSMKEGEYYMNSNYYYCMFLAT